MLTQDEILEFPEDDNLRDFIIDGDADDEQLPKNHFYETQDVEFDEERPAPDPSVARAPLKTLKQVNKSTRTYF